MDEQFEVKAILAHREGEEEREYLIAWKTCCEPSWEGASNLDCARLLSDYYKKRGLTLSKRKGSQKEPPKKRLSKHVATKALALKKFRQSCQKLEIKEVKSLLEAKVNINVQMENFHCLHIACGENLEDAATASEHEASSRKFLQFLLEQPDINLNPRTMDNNDTPLIIAAFNGFLGHVRLLKHAGALLDVKGEKGNTAIQWAAIQENWEVVSYLQTLVPVAALTALDHENKTVAERLKNKKSVASKSLATSRSSTRSSTRTSRSSSLASPQSPSLLPTENEVVTTSLLPPLVSPTSPRTPSLRLAKKHKATTSELPSLINSPPHSPHENSPTVPIEPSSPVPSSPPPSSVVPPLSSSSPPSSLFLPSASPAASTPGLSLVVSSSSLFAPTIPPVVSSSSLFAPTIPPVVSSPFLFAPIIPPVVPSSSLFVPIIPPVSHSPPSSSPSSVPSFSAPASFSSPTSSSSCSSSSFSFSSFPPATSSGFSQTNSPAFSPPISYASPFFSSCFSPSFSSASTTTSDIVYASQDDQDFFKLRLTQPPTFGDIETALLATPKEADPASAIILKEKQYRAIHVWALHAASPLDASREDLEASLLQCLGKGKCFLQRKDCSGMSPLHLVLMHASRPSLHAELLLAHGASLSAEEHDFRQNAVEYAVRFKQPECLRSMLRLASEQGLLGELRQHHDKRGLSAVHHAAMLGHKEELTLLLQNKFPLSLTRSRTPLTPLELQDATLRAVSEVFEANKHLGDNVVVAAQFQRILSAYGCKNFTLGYLKIWQSHLSACGVVMLNAMNPLKNRVSLSEALDCINEETKRMGGRDSLEPCRTQVIDASMADLNKKYCYPSGSNDPVLSLLALTGELNEGFALCRINDPRNLAWRPDNIAFGIFATDSLEVVERIPLAELQGEVITEQALKQRNEGRTGCVIGPIGLLPPDHWPEKQELNGKFILALDRYRNYGAFVMDGVSSDDSNADLEYAVIDGWPHVFVVIKQGQLKKGDQVVLSQRSQGVDLRSRGD